MSDLNKKIELFGELGNKIKGLTEQAYQEIITRANAINPWFTEENIRLAFKGLTHFFDQDNLRHWLSNYSIKYSAPKNIGLIMAGNVPMVGMHDLLCVLITGNTATIKYSSQDTYLPEVIINWLSEIDSDINSHVRIVDRIKSVNAIIATGSNNSSRYFKYYFKHIPHFIRKNRTGIAVLSGYETKNELEDLGKDIFYYFGLGCRNVSKIFVPEQYNFRHLKDALSQFEHLKDHNKYRNNYDYQKAILLVNNIGHIDTGFCIFRLSDELVSPISTIYYQEYKSMNDLKSYIDQNKDKVQVVVSNNKFNVPTVKFGQAQFPELWDYADGIDTIAFLTGL